MLFTVTSWKSAAKCSGASKAGTKSATMHHFGTTASKLAIIFIEIIIIVTFKHDIFTLITAIHKNNERTTKLIGCIAIEHLTYTGPENGS